MTLILQCILVQLPVHGMWCTWLHVLTLAVAMLQGGWEMVAHHIAATLSIWTALTAHQGHFYTLTFLATEVTTPFVNLRWCLDTVVSTGSILSVQA